MGLLYFSDPSLSAGEQKQVRQLFENREGIAAVVAPEQFSQYGLPNPRSDSQMADLVLLASPGFGFSARADGDELVVPGESAGVYKGNHGFVADQREMNAVFVASGAGLRQGVRLGEIANLDVAPTAAALLGLTLPSARWPCAHRGPVGPGCEVEQ